MHFMLVTLAVLICIVVWGFFHSNPQGVPKVKLLALNIGILAVAALLGAVAGYALYQDAIVVKAGEPGLAAYLAMMAGGTGALIVVAAGGMIRNLLVFPISRRAPGR